VWNLTCDWYLELTKPVLAGDDAAAKTETQATVAWLLEQIAAMLHPIMPYLTEELWGKAARDTDDERPVLALSAWPQLSFEDAAAADEINWLVELISAVRSVRSEMNVPAGAMVTLFVAGATFTTATRLQTYDALIRRLARVETVSLASTPVKGAVQIVVGEATISMPLEGVIDLEAEKSRLTKEVDRVAKEIAKIEAKLGNEQFVAKAPEEVIEEQRERLTEAMALRNKTAAALSRLIH
jgi:valyl-tRNA synthetase